MRQYWEIEDPIICQQLLQGAQHDAAVAYGGQVGLATSPFVIKGSKQKNKGTGYRADFGKLQFVQAVLREISPDLSNLGSGRAKWLVDDVNKRLADNPAFQEQYPNGKVTERNVHDALEASREANR
jgi:hypothetical protein